MNRHKVKMQMFSIPNRKNIWFCQCAGITHCLSQSFKQSFALFKNQPFALFKNQPGSKRVTVKVAIVVVFVLVHTAVFGLNYAYVFRAITPVT